MKLTEGAAPLQRVQPANIEAEQILLGSIIINNNLLEQVNEFLRPEHFYEKLHQKIYQAIETLLEKGLSSTIVTLKSMLDKDSMYQMVGGDSYLEKLTTIAVVVINPYEYGKIIYDLALKRNLIEIGESIVNGVYDSTLEYPAQQHIEEAENKLYNLANTGINDKSFIKISDSIEGSLKSIHNAMKNEGHITGIDTGFSALNEKLFGFQKSDLVIVAGRPSMGKTAFAINFALNACKFLVNNTKEGEKAPAVGVFSLEMSAEQIATRLISMVAQVDSKALKTGKLTEEYYNNLMSAVAEFRSMPFFIDDTPALSIAALRNRVRKFQRKNKLGILFVDYLQLLRGSAKTENRVIEIAEITQGLKAIAKEFGIPVIALAQLSRAVEQRADRRPILSDLRESGSIEQDADVVMFLYREEYYLAREKPEDSNHEKMHTWQEKMAKALNKAEIIIAKHRNGAIGNVELSYNPEYSLIKDLIN